MSNRVTRRRATAVLTALALGVAPVAAVAGGVAAQAAPVRTASTSTDTTYLQDTLGVPANTVIETVTYDRFQYILANGTGDFAFLVGDPVEDPNFKAEAQGADAAARAAGVKKVYWFDPNLSGSVTVGSTPTPNLDIRNPAGITTITAASQAIYGRAWLNLVGQYLGNGVTAIPASVGTESQTVGGTVNSNTGALTGPIQTQTATVNDANSPLYDYTTATPTSPATDVADSQFFVYNRANTTGGATPVADKLVQSVDFDTAVGADTGAAATTDATTAVAGALTALGDPSAIATSTEFDFWKTEVNQKEAAQGTPGNQAAVLDDADDAQPWAVDQITYPELIHLLNVKDSATKNFVILFGGTWCPNTRAVLKDVNAQAQANNVTVYNFDTVLDGGTVGGAGPNGSGIAGGSTTSSANPLQVRNTANNGTGAAVANANPSFVYGTLLSTYFKNIATQYEPDNGTYVTYYPNGDSAQPIKVVRKLQVPFLIDYQRGTASSPSGTAIKRQWIQQNLDPSTGLASFTEYMTEFYVTHPEADRLGLAASKFPLALPIPGLAGFDPRSPVYPDSTVYTDAAQYLDPNDTVASQTPAALAAALSVVSAHGVSVSTPTDVTAALAASTDADLTAALTTVKAAWTLAGTRKSSVINALANIPFAQEAIAKLGTFFGGLPGGVVSTQTVAAPAVAYGAAPQVNVAIANDYGRVPTGDVTLSIGGQSYTQAVAQSSASFSLPTLTPGSYGYTVSYAGDDQILAFSKTGTLEVGKTGAQGLSGAVAAAPTPAAAGSYRVTVGTASGLAAATGTAMVTVTKGATSYTLTGALAAGTATIAVPKLAPGTWSVAISWAGDANYSAATAGDTITVAKVKAKKVAATVQTKPTTTKAGKIKVTVTAATGVAKATGKVTVKIAKKGATTKSVTGTLKNGSVTVSVPKLAKGTWTATVGWAGDANHLAGAAKTTIKVVR